MSCADIQREFFASKRQINNTIAKRSKARSKNAALVAAGVIFTPALFFLDVKSSESNEILAFLSDLAYMKHCMFTLPQ